MSLNLQKSIILSRRFTGLPKYENYRNTSTKPTNSNTNHTQYATHGNEQIEAEAHEQE
jgi:hypothetical protein